MAATVGHDMNKVPLEEALKQIGGRHFENTLALVGGLILFSGLEVVLAPSYIIPAAECDLKLDFTQKGLLTSAGFTGMIFSSHLVGYLSDSYGRKTVIVRSCFISACILFASSFSPSYEILLVLWIVNGLFVTGIISPAYVYITEFTVTERKAKLLLIASAVCSLATTYQPGMAWLVLPIKEMNIFGYKYHSWRLFTAVSAVFPLLCSIIMIMFPESPKFMISIGKSDKALKDLRRMFVFNTGSNHNHFKVKALTADKGDEHEAAKVTGIIQFLNSLVTQTVLLFSRRYLLHTLIGSSMVFAIVGAYNIIMMWIPDIVNKVTDYSNSHDQLVTVCEVIKSYNLNIGESKIEINGTDRFLSNSVYNVTSLNRQMECTSQINEEVFITNMLIGAVQFTIFLGASSLTALIGRKTFIAGNLFLAAICVLSLTWVTIPYVIFFFMGAVAVLMGATLPVSLSIIVDLFPTFIRSMGSAMSMVFGRIGVAVGNPLFGYLQQINCNAGYYGMSVLLGGICCLSFLLPVKRNAE